MNEAVAAVAFTYFALACAWDLKQRIVPDWLNFAATAAAFCSAALAGVLSLEFVAGVAAAFSLAFLLYKIGVWGGGDAKFFTGATAFFLVVVPSAGWTGFAVFFADSVFAAVPAALFLHAKDLWRLRRELAGFAVPALRSAAKTGLLGAAAGTAFVSASNALTQFLSPWTAYAVVFVAALAAPFPLWAAGIVFAAAALLDWQKTAALFAAAFAVGFAAFYCVKAFRVVSSKVLRRTVEASEWREGMIPAHTIVLRDGRAVVVEGPSLAAVVKAARKLDVKQLLALLAPASGRVLVDCRKARGLTQAEIKELKAAGVTSLEVKESMAFAPVLVAGWVAAALWGLSWLLH